MEKLKILLPTDCSPVSLKAIRYSLMLNEYFQGKIFFFHSILIEGVEDDLVKNLFDILAKEASERITEMVDKLQKITNTTFSYEVVIAHGFPVNEINTYVKSNEIDLIIMGSKGASGLEKVLVGSNASKMALNPPCPVMIIPGKVDIKRKIKNIVYATDLSGLEKEIGIAVAFARLFNAQLHVLHFYPENLIGMEFDTVRFASSLMKKYDYENISFEAIMDNNTINGLHCYAELNKPGMLMLYRHPKSASEQVFDPDISKEYAFGTELPLLIIPPENNKDRMK